MGTLRLAVTLTTEDRLSIGAEMSAAQTALEAVKAEKKAEMAEYNEQIKGHEATVHDRNSILRAGVIMRDVQVEVRANPESGKHETWRLDTNTVVRAADMDPDERQVRLSLEGPKIMQGGKAADAAEEQLAAGSPEEAEAMRADRLAHERMERISAAVSTERARITVMRNQADGPLEGTLTFGDHILTGIGPDDEQCRDAIIRQLVPILEEQEDLAAMTAAEDVQKDRATRIDEAVAEVRPRISVVPQPDETDPMRAFKAVLQYANVVLEAEAETEEAARAGVERQVRDDLEANTPATMADAIAASAAEQARQEVERLVAEQAADAATTGGLRKGGLKPPKGYKRKGRKKQQDGDATPEGDAAAGEDPGAPANGAAEASEGEAVTLEIDGVTMEQPLCPPGCDANHSHTDERAAF